MHSDPRIDSRPTTISARIKLKINEWKKRPSSVIYLYQSLSRFFFSCPSASANAWILSFLFKRWTRTFESATIGVVGEWTWLQKGATWPSSPVDLDKSVYTECITHYITLRIAKQRNCTQTWSFVRQRSCLRTWDTLTMLIHSSLATAWSET